MTTVCRILLENNRKQKNYLALISPAIPSNVSKATAPEEMHISAVWYPLVGISFLKHSWNWDFSFHFPKYRRAKPSISNIVLIIKNTSAELTVLKKVKVNAVINGNENTIPHVMAAIVETPC